eukprot:296291-Prymnesium_polylepis.2
MTSCAGAGDSFSRWNGTGTPESRLRDALPLAWVHMRKAGTSFGNVLFHHPQICHLLPVNVLIRFQGLGMPSSDGTLGTYTTSAWKLNKYNGRAAWVSALPTRTEALTLHRTHSRLVSIGRSGRFHPIHTSIHTHKVRLF